MEICFQTLRRWSGGGKGILTNSMRSCRKNFLLKTSTYMYPLDLAGATNLARALTFSQSKVSLARHSRVTQEPQEIPWKRENNRLERLEVFLTYNVQHGQSLSLFTDRSSI